jgi:hypothetical protein
MSAPEPSKEEAAAIIAAVARFMRETAAPGTRVCGHAESWREAALAEGVERSPEADLSDPWINT